MATEWERAQKAREREEKRLYLEQRSNQVDGLNWQIDQTIKRIENFLTRGIREANPDPESLRTPFSVEAFNPGILGHAESPPSPDAFKVRPLGIRKLFRSAQEQHAIATSEAERQYRQAVDEHHLRESKRRADLQKAENEYRVRAAEIARRNDAYRVALASADPAAIVEFFERTLEAAPFQDLLLGFRLAYVPDSKQLVVERDFPPVATIPEIKSYRFVKTKDQVTQTTRPATQIKGLYGRLVSQLSLLTMHQLFAADQDGHIESLVFNGYLDTVDRSTGKRIRPCLVTVRTTRTAVGVSAVRDLFGTVHNEGASKGILVTTSGYGRASFEFANAKPLELIDGSGLLYLLEEHAGISARIEPPDDWVDPVGWD